MLSLTVVIWDRSATGRFPNTVYFEKRGNSGDGKQSISDMKWFSLLRVDQVLAVSD